MISGLTITDSSVNTDVADCFMGIAQLFCTAKSFEDASFADVSYAPFVDKFLYVGVTLSIYSSMSIVDGSTGTVRSYVYSSTKMSS
eukprot:gene9631-11323_t